MLTVLADCEIIANSRIGTYMSEKELVKPISSAIIRKDIDEWGLPNTDAVVKIFLGRRNIIMFSSYRDAKQLTLF